MLDDKNSRNKEEQSLQEQMLRLMTHLGAYLFRLGQYHDADWDVDDDKMSQAEHLSQEGY